MDLSSSYSFVHHNPIVIATDDSKLVLSLVRNATNSFQIRIQKMQPDSMEVGNDLEEAEYLMKYFAELVTKLKSKKTLITESVLKQESANDLSLLWSETDKQLELREKLLTQALKFHTIAKLFSKKMDLAGKFFDDLVENEITSAEIGYSIIENHKNAKKEILEASLITFEEGKELLSRLREMSLCSDLYGTHSTTSVIYSIESLLERLNERRCSLEELWQQRRLKLEQCIQLCYLKRDIQKTLDWVINEGSLYLEDARLGTNYQEAIELQRAHEKFEKEYNKPIHENVMKCIRTADQFIHTGLEKADEAHQEAHELLEKWEKMALKLDQRRKLLAIVVSFYRQTEQATDRLNQLEKEIKIEHERAKRLNSDSDPEGSPAKKISTIRINVNTSNEDTAKSSRTNSPNLESVQRNADLQTQLAEITAPCLREGKIVLEKVCKEDSQAEHVIRKFYEFSEQVNELKSKLSNDMKDEINKSAENLNESKRMSEIIDYENKYNNLFTWIMNVGETFLTQHRDIGVDIAYVSDYLDNHQQMELDLKENQLELNSLKELKEVLIKTLSSSTSDEDQLQIETIRKNLDLMETKWNKLKRSVQNRIVIASNYLVFVKQKNQLRSLALDLQELFKALADYSLTHNNSDFVLENRVQEKMQIFENLYKELIRNGHDSISLLKKSDNEVLKLNSNHLISDIEIMLNESNSLYETIKSNLEIWSEKVASRRQFKEEWQNFMIQSRCLIQRVMQTEEGFFPKLAGDLGDSLEISEAFQKRLDDFMPIVKKITHDIEECITRAEILALNGDTQGQKDLIINELTKVRQKFLSRLNEFKSLLQKTINFYKNFKKLDNVITEAEKSYTTNKVGNDLVTVENQFKKHMYEKEQITKLINFSSGEGEEIIAKNRQQGAETEAIEPIRKLITKIDERKKAWEKAWEDREKCFKRKLETIQAIVEKSQINRDLDLLMNEVDHRKKNVGSNLEQIQRNIECFSEITDNMNICSDNINRWRSNVNKIIYLRRSDHEDALQQQELQENIDKIDQKWSALHSFVNGYRDQLAKTTQLLKLLEEIEDWTSQKTQLVYKFTSSDLTTTQLNKHIEEIKHYNDLNLDKIRRLANEVYGELDGPNRIKHVVTKSVNLLNNFIELKDSLSENEKSKKRTSQIYHESALTDTECGPDFEKKLESNIVLNGSKHTFECVVTGAQPLEIKWFKNGTELINSSNVLINYDDKSGLCSLTLKEVNSNDNALFSCKVKNYFGLAETSAYLKVKETLKLKGSAPLVVSPLESVQLNADSTYTLECIISGEPEPNITWYKDSVEIDALPEPLRSTYKQSKFINVRQLTITNTDSDLHSGAYTCRARNEYGEADCSCGVLVRKPITRTIVSEMNKAPVIDEPMAPTYTLKQGKRIVLKCHYTAYPRCDVIWLRDNQPIDLNLMGLSKEFKISVEVDSTSLEIKEAHPDDSGVYSVIIRNSLGQDKSTTQLFVKENSQDTNNLTNEETRPTLLRHLKNVETKQGAFVRLDLYACGEPQPDIRWYQNDQQIQSDKHRVFEVKENKYSLIIDKCDLSDSGEYKAVLSNLYGEIQSKSRLNVQATSSLVKQNKNPPIFVELVKDTRVTKGQDVCLRCKLAPSEETPLVNWYKDGQLVTETTKIKMASQEDNSYLVISNASSQDAGVYTATATNSNGEAKSYGRLTVSEQSSEHARSRSVESTQHFSASHSSTSTTTTTTNKIGGQAPEFKKLFFDRHVSPGEDVRLDAVITGSPKPKIKWLLPQDNLPQDNCRCIMAGDSYSFIISDFQEKNIGRYSITAENQHGKSTCSAKLVFEGTDFSEIPDEPVLDVAVSSDEAYVKDLISAAKSNLFSTSSQQSSTIITSAKAESKTIGIETVPVATRELSIQSAIPQTRDISSQSQSIDTKETGIQIKTDVIDKSSQIESVKSTATRDEASQSEFGRVSSVGIVESAPFVQKSTAESHFSSSFESKSNVTRSFSYTQQQQQSVGFSASSSTGMIGASSSASRSSTITTPSVAQHPQPVSADYSTTLIKDINQHYEPVELILNRSDSAHGHHHHHQAASSSTYIKEVDDHHHHHHQHHHHHHQRQQINRFEPVNLIFPRPFYGAGRSGSLPPVVSRVNYKTSNRSDFEHTDTEDDSSFYYQDNRSVENKENFATYSAESKLTYYKGIERKARPQFKPVELVLDASSLADSSHKRRDTSHPASMQSKRIRTPVTSSFIYDNSNEYDSSTSDFVSERAETEAKYRQIRSQMNMEDKEAKGCAVKLPCMEMTIDLKAPPTIEVPLKNVHSAEGQFVKLECVVNGKPAPTVKWYKEGNEIEPNASEGIEISFEVGVGVATLAIRQVALKDSGRYTCVARNVIGSCSSSATITIQGINESSFSHGTSLSAQQFRQQRNMMNQSQVEQHVVQQTQQQQHLQQHLYQLQMQQQQYQQQLHQQQLEQQEQFEQEHHYQQIQQHQQQSRIQQQQIHQTLEQQQHQRLVQMGKATTTTVSSKTEEEYAQEQAYQQQLLFQQQQQQQYAEEAQYKQSMEMIYNEIDPNRPEPQLIRSLPNYLKFTEGQPARLEVEVSGTPAPIVNWFKNNVLIHGSLNIEISSNLNVHTMSIPEIFIEDSGVYKAVIASPLGVLESHCEISVEVAKKSSSPRSQSDSPQRRKPKIDQHQQEYATRYEHTSQYQMQQQQIQQQQAERKLSYYSQTEVKPFQNSVQMTPTQPRASSVSKSVSITPLNKPQFAKHLQNATFKQGDIVLIQCIAKGSPDTVVKWYRNGALIEANDEYAMAYDSNNGLCSLSIAEARSQDSGQYTCVATNSIGSESSTAWIVVKEPSQERLDQQQQQQPQSKQVGARPGFQKQTTPLRLGSIESSKVEVSETTVSQQTTIEAGVKPRVLEPLRDVEFVEAASALLECRLQGQQLNIQWYKSNILITSQYRYKMSYDEISGMSRLFIATVLEDDAGEYTCRASNSFGEVATSANLIPIENNTEFGKYVVGHPNRQPPVQQQAPPEEPVKRKPEEMQRPQSKQLRPSSRENYYTPQPMPPMTPQPMPPMTPIPHTDDVFEPANRFGFDQPAPPMPPKILRGIKSEQVNEDDTIILKALVTGNPFPRCSWYKNNYPLIMSQRHSVYEEESKKLCGLKIKNAKEDDSGVYTLVVDNLYGSDDSTAQVIVNVSDARRIRPRHGSFSSVPSQQPQEKLLPPKVVTQSLPEITINEGEPIILSCMVEALPLPQFAIFKNEVPLPASARVKTTFDPNNGIFTIRIDDTTVNDAGSYKICADNVCGRAETHTAVYVGKVPVIEAPSNIDPEAFKNMHQPVESVPPAPPTPVAPVEPEPVVTNFEVPPNFLIGLPPNYKLKEGESIKLTCQVEGNPRPVVTWLKDGKNLPQSLRFNTSYIVPTGMSSLTVTGTLQTDCGNYTCVAENPAGKAYTTSQVFVKESKPKSNRYEPEDSQTDDDVPLNRAKPPKVIHGLTNQKLTEGETVVMACKIDGFPKPHLVWLKDGFELPASNRYTSHYDISSGVARLVIGGSVLNDAGVYSVIAENKAGTDRTDARLEIMREAPVDNKPIATGSFAIYKPSDLQPTPQPIQQQPQPVYEQPGYVTSEFEEEPVIPPRVVVPLKDATVTEGQQLTLMAKIIGTPAPRILWLHNDRPIQESSRYTYNYEISSGVASFKINGVQINDVGTYTAIAENRAGAVNTTARVDLGQVSYIDTTPIVNPEAFRYLEKTPQQQRKLRTPSGVDPRQLQSPRVPETPRESRRGHVDDQVANSQPPRFTIPLQNARIEEGKSISLACKVEGYPKPRVTWFKDNKPLSASTRYTPDYDLYTGIVKLHISDAQMHDAGHYTAVAENDVGQDQTSCQAAIKQVPNIDRTPMVNPNAFRYLEHLPAERAPRDKVDKLMPPKVVIPLQNVKLEEGQSVVLACKIEGNPKPRLTWYKDSVVLPAANRYTTDYDLSTNVATLKIDNAQLKDLGAYVVLAENQAGSDQTTCTVFIQQVPSIDRTPMVNPDAFRYLENRSAPKARVFDEENVNLLAPKVIVPLKDMELKEEEPVLLICKIEGKPRPKLTWFKDSKPLPASNRYETDYNLSTDIALLKISNALKNDIGNYLVLAENKAGKDQTFCKLYIKSSPNVDETPLVNPEAFRLLEAVPVQPVDEDNEKEKYFPPYVIIPLTDLTLIEGCGVRLACKIDGYPKPKLTWFKNNEPLMASQRFDIEYNLSTCVASLHIKQTKPLDIGVYRLMAENIMGKADTTCQLFVKATSNIDETAYVDPSSFRSLEVPHKHAAASDTDEIGEPQPPVIVRPLQDIECFEGEIATFVCEVKGNPKPSIHWTQDGAPLKAAQRVAANYLINEGKAIIVISNVKQGDLGKYTLTARNKHGEASSTAQLNVKLVPAIDDTSYVNPDAFQQFEAPGQQPTGTSEEQYKKPYFVKVPKNADVREGAVLRLDCLAFGRPFPVLTWFFNGTELLQDANHKVLINEEGVNSLLISVAHFSDSGIYSCVARNKAGEASFNVEIKVVDKDAMIAPFFIEHLKNAQFIPEGQDAILSCTCSGTPIPTITWQKDVAQLTPDVEYRIDTNGGHSRLFIQCALQEDDGWYTCTATNAAGTAMTRTKINVLPPGQVNVVTPDLSKLNKTPQDLKELPGFVNTLHSLKHVVAQQGQARLPPEILGQNFGSIWSKDELEDQETMYNKDRPIPPKFKTHFKSQLNLRERQPARFYAKLIPIGDPTMKIQWYRNGEPLRSATRYEIKYDFGLVSLDLLWSYPEDNGVYECVATNEAGQDRTKAELKCKANRSIIYDTQLPEGLESHYRLQELEDKLKIQAMMKEDVQEEEQPDPSAPEVVLKLENVVAEEGGLAKFMAKITGYPKPRVHWFVNGTHAISGSKFKLYFDGMIHYLDIPKTVKAEHEGQVRCFAKNMMGQCETTCQLRIKPKIDYRSVLRNRSSDMDETFYQPIVIEDRMTTPERKLMERVSTLSRPKQKHSSQVDNRVAPTFTRQLQPMNAKEGETVMLSVEFAGSPIPEVFWYKDGLQMESSIDFHIESTATGSILKIREAYKSDSGVYSVKLFNEIGITQCKAYLAVVPIHLQDMTPKILLDLNSLTVNSGDPVKFQTQAKGDPEPVLTWFKDDEPLEMTTRVKEFIEDNVHTLLIMETVAADSGCYECVAENAHGKTYTRAYLNVIGDKTEEQTEESQQKQPKHKPGEKSLPLASRYTQPAIEVALTDQVVKEGSSAKFECTIAHSVEHAHVHWYKDDKVIKQSKYFNMVSNNTKHSLNILEAFPEDEGVYKCVAKNPAGQVSTTASLRIEQNLTVPEFITTTNDTEAEENSPTKLSAKIKPDPTVHVEWSHEGASLKDSANHIIKTNLRTGELTLLINSTKQKDSGTYSVRVFNGAGSINCSANLIVKNVAATNNRSSPIAKFAKGTDARVDIYFDNNVFRKLVRQTLDSLEVKWFYNGINIKASEKFVMLKQKEIATLQINQIDFGDTGVYAVQIYGKSSQPLATLNIQTVIDYVTTAIQSYDFTQSNKAEWILKERVQKEQKDEPSIRLLAPIPKEFRVKTGEDFRIPITFKTTLNFDVQWFADDVQIVSSEKHKIINSKESSTLVIKNVEQSDQHEYKVVIKNEKDTFTYKTFLHVTISEPKTKQQPQQQQSAKIVLKPAQKQEAPKQEAKPAQPPKQVTKPVQESVKQPQESHQTESTSTPVQTSTKTSKPVSQPKEEPKQEQIKLKPASRVVHPQEETKLDINLKPVSKNTDEVEESKQEVKLKPITKVAQPEETKQEFKLKPVPRVADEVEQAKLEQEVETKTSAEGSSLVQTPTQVKPTAPKTSKPVSQPKEEPKQEQIKLKPASRVVHPQEETKLDINLKPVSKNTDEVEESKQEIKLKPVPREAEQQEVSKEHVKSIEDKPVVTETTEETEVTEEIISEEQTEIIEEEIKFIKKLEDKYEFKAGETAKIRTEISETIRNPVFKWYCNGIQLKTNEKTQILTERHISTLHIINVQHTDNGQYDCLVENTSGQKLLQSSCIINISGSPTKLVQTKEQKLAREEIISEQVESINVTEELKPVVQDRSQISEIASSEAIRQEQKSSLSQILAKPKEELVETSVESAVESSIERVVEDVSHVSDVVNENLKQDQFISSKQILAKPIEEYEEQKDESLYETRLEIEPKLPQISEVISDRIERDQKITSKQILVKPKQDALDEINETVAEAGIEHYAEDKSQISEIAESVQQNQQIQSQKVLSKPKEELFEEKTESSSDVLIENVDKSVVEISQVKLEQMSHDQKIQKSQILAKPKEEIIDENAEQTTDTSIEQRDENVPHISEANSQDVQKSQVVTFNQILVKPKEDVIDELTESTTETDIKQISEDKPNFSDVVVDKIEKTQIITSSKILSKPKEDFVDETYESTLEANISQVREDLSQMSETIPEKIQETKMVTQTKILAKPKEVLEEEKTESIVESQIEYVEDKPKISKASTENLTSEQTVTSTLIFNKERVDAIDKEISEHETFGGVQFENLVSNVTKSEEHLSEISQVVEPHILEKSLSQSSDINADIMDIISEINETQGKKPYFSQLLEDQEFDDNDNVHLDCFVEGQAPITIKWFFNNQMIQPSNDANVEIFRELGVCSMEIITATKKYQGEYKCHGSNEFGDDTTTCKLVYIGDKKSKELLIFIEPLQDQYVEIDSEVYLDCTVKDIRKTDTIEWYHNNTLIMKDVNENIEMFNEVGVCSLQIRKMIVELQGHYCCKVRDVEGYIVAETSCYLNLDEQSTDYLSKMNLSKSEEAFADESSSSDEKLSLDACPAGIAPMFLQALEDIELEEGEDLELKCQIMGAPIPEIACYFAKNITEKTAIKKIRNEFIHYNYETGICKIEIKNVTSELNDGFYMVKALNDAGSLTTVCQAKVKPKSYPSLNIQSECPPNFIIKLEPEIKIMDGQEVNLVCVCVALPEAEIKWLRSTHENLNEFIPVVLNNDMRATFDKSTGKCALKITDTYPQDSGVFICIATNKYGQAETRTNLIVESYTYEKDSEEGSSHVDLQSESATYETNNESDAGTLTPIPERSKAFSIDESIMSDESLLLLQPSELTSTKIVRKHDVSVSDNEYFTAQSEFAESSASSSNWKKE